MSWIHQFSVESIRSWSEPERKAFADRLAEPERFFYFFVAPGLALRQDDFDQEENEVLLEQIRQFRRKKWPIEGSWGLFSLALPNRCGYQCRNQYFKLVSGGELEIAAVDRTLLILGEDSSEPAPSKAVLRLFRRDIQQEFDDESLWDSVSARVASVGAMPESANIKERAEPSIAPVVAVAGADASDVVLYRERDNAPEVEDSEDSELQQLERSKAPAIEDSEDSELQQLERSKAPAIEDSEDSELQQLERSKAPAIEDSEDSELQQLERSKAPAIEDSEDSDVVLQRLERGKAPEIEDSESANPFQFSASSSGESSGEELLLNCLHKSKHIVVGSSSSSSSEEGGPEQKKEEEEESSDGSSIVIVSKPPEPKRKCSRKAPSSARRPRRPAANSPPPEKGEDAVKMMWNELRVLERRLLSLKDAPPATKRRRVQFDAPQSRSTTAPGTRNIASGGRSRASNSSRSGGGGGGSRPVMGGGNFSHLRRLEEAELEESEEGSAEDLIERGSVALPTRRRAEDRPPPSLSVLQRRLSALKRKIADSLQQARQKGATSTSSLAALLEDAGTLGTRISTAVASPPSPLERSLRRAGGFEEARPSPVLLAPEVEVERVCSCTSLPHTAWCALPWRKPSSWTPPRLFLHETTRVERLSTFFENGGGFRTLELMVCSEEAPSATPLLSLLEEGQKGQHSPPDSCGGSPLEKIALQSLSFGEQWQWAVSQSKSDSFSCSTPFSGLSVSMQRMVRLLDAHALLLQLLSLHLERTAGSDGAKMRVEGYIKVILEQLLLLYLQQPISFLLDGYATVGAVPAALWSLWKMLQHCYRLLGLPFFSLILGCVHSLKYSCIDSTDSGWTGGWPLASPSDSVAVAKRWVCKRCCIDASISSLFDRSGRRVELERCSVKGDWYAGLLSCVRMFKGFGGVVGLDVMVVDTWIPGLLAGAGLAWWVLRLWKPGDEETHCACQMVVSELVQGLHAAIQLISREVLSKHRIHATVEDVEEAQAPPAPRDAWHIATGLQMEGCRCESMLRCACWMPPPVVAICSSQPCRQHFFSLLDLLCLIAWEALRSSSSLQRRQMVQSLSTLSLFAADRLKSSSDLAACCSLLLLCCTADPSQIKALKRKKIAPILLPVLSSVSSGVEEQILALQTAGWIGMISSQTSAVQISFSVSTAAIALSSSGCISQLMSHSPASAITELAVIVKMFRGLIQSQTLSFEDLLSVCNSTGIILSILAGDVPRLRHGSPVQVSAAGALAMQSTALLLQTLTAITGTLEAAPSESEIAPKGACLNFATRLEDLWKLIPVCIGTVTFSAPADLGTCLLFANARHDSIQSVFENLRSVFQVLGSTVSRMSMFVVHAARVDNRLLQCRTHISNIESILEVQWCSSRVGPLPDCCSNNALAKQFCGQVSEYMTSELFSGVDGGHLRDGSAQLQCLLVEDPLYLIHNWLLAGVDLSLWPIGCSEESFDVWKRHARRLDGFARLLHAIPDSTARFRTVLIDLFLQVSSASDAQLLQELAGSAEEQEGMDVETEGDSEAVVPTTASNFEAIATRREKMICRLIANIRAWHASLAGQPRDTLLSVVGIFQGLDKVVIASLDLLNRNYDREIAMNPAQAGVMKAERQQVAAAFASLCLGIAREALFFLSDLLSYGLSTMAAMAVDGVRSLLQCWMTAVAEVPSAPWQIAEPVAARSLHQAPERWAMVVAGVSSLCYMLKSFSQLPYTSGCVGECLVQALTRFLEYSADRWEQECFFSADATGGVAADEILEQIVCGLLCLPDPVSEAAIQNTARFRCTVLIRFVGTWLIAPLQGTAASLSGWKHMWSRAAANDHRHTLALCLLLRRLILHGLGQERHVVWCSQLRQHTGAEPVVPMRRAGLSSDEILWIPAILLSLTRSLSPDTPSSCLVLAELARALERWMQLAHFMNTLPSMLLHNVIHLMVLVFVVQLRGSYGIAARPAAVHWESRLHGQWEVVRGMLERNGTGRVFAAHLRAPYTFVQRVMGYGLERPAPEDEAASRGRRAPSAAGLLPVAVDKWMSALFSALGTCCVVIPASGEAFVREVRAAVAECVTASEPEIVRRHKRHQESFMRMVE